MPSPYKLCVDYPPSQDCPFGSRVLQLEKRLWDNAIVVKKSRHNNIIKGDVLLSLDGVPLNGDGGIDGVVDLFRQSLKNGMKIEILRIDNVGSICTFVDLSTNERCGAKQLYKKGALGLCQLHMHGLCKFIENGKSCTHVAIGVHGYCVRHNYGPCKFIENGNSCTSLAKSAHGHCGKHQYGSCTYMINHTVGCMNVAVGTHGLCENHRNGPTRLARRGRPSTPGPLRLMLEKMEEFMEQLKPNMTEEQFERMDFIHRQRLDFLANGLVDPVSLNQRVLALVEKEAQAYFAARDNQNKWVRRRRNNVIGWEELERYVHSRAHTSIYIAFRDFLCDEIDYSALSPELMITIMTGIVDAFKGFCRDNNGKLCAYKIGSSGVEGSLGLGSIRTNDTVMYPDEAFKPSSWTSLHLNLPREERYIAESFGIFAAGFGVTCNLEQPRNLIPDTDNCRTSTLYVYSSKFGSISDHFGGYGLHRHGPHVPPGHHLVPISQLPPSDSGVSVLDTSSADDNDDNEFASADFNQSGSSEYISSVSTSTTGGEFSSIDYTTSAEASSRDRDEESSPTNVMDFSAANHGSVFASGKIDGGISATARLKTDDAANATQSSNSAIASASTANSGIAPIAKRVSTSASSNDSASLGGSPMVGQKRKSISSEQSSIDEDKSLEVQLQEQNLELARLQTEDLKRKRNTEDLRGRLFRAAMADPGLALKFATNPHVVNLVVEAKIHEIPDNEAPQEGMLQETMKAIQTLLNARQS